MGSTKCFFVEVKECCRKMNYYPNNQTSYYYPNHNNNNQMNNNQQMNMNNPIHPIPEKTYACSQCGESCKQDMFSASQLKNCKRNMPSRCKICLGQMPNNAPHFQCSQCGDWLTPEAFSKTQLANCKRNLRGSCRGCLHGDDVTEFRKQ